MSSSRKKVIVRKLDRDWLAGYLPAVGFIRQGGLELLDLTGKVVPITLSQIKWLCYVRDFNSGEPENPERLLRKNYLGRPRSEGLWVRIQLVDGDAIEGLATNDVSLLDGDGISIAPPDARSNTQRIFIPRSAVAEFVIVAAITSPSRRKIEGRPVQEDLFA